MSWLTGCFGAAKRTVSVEIKFPDSSRLTITYSRTARTRQLITSAVDHLRLKREGEFFGLAYKGKGGCDLYLDPNRTLYEQLPKTAQNQQKPALKFRVRYYPPDPQRLKEEAARHWLYLQIRSDLLNGDLDASDEAAAELAAYAAQAEQGDYGNIKDQEYDQLKLVPRQVPKEWIEEVKTCHRQLVQLSRQESEQRFLWRARKLEKYGEQRFRLQPLGGSAKEGEAILSAKGLEIRLGNPEDGQSQFLRWRHITQLDYREKTFELRTQNGMIMPAKTIDRASCKALFQQATGHHSLFRHYKEREHDRDASKFSLHNNFDRSNQSQRASKRELGMFTDKSDVESMAGRTTTGSVSRFPPAKGRRRQSRERGTKTSGDESEVDSRKKRMRRRDRVRNAMTDTEAVKQDAHFSRNARASTEKLVQPQFPSTGFDLNIRSKKADIDAKTELWKNIEKELIEPGQNGIDDLAFVEVTTKGNPLALTRQMQKQRRAQQQYGSQGRVNSANGRRRRRDRIERAIATDIEEAGMVGPLPVTASVIKDDRGAMSDWDVKFYPGRNQTRNRQNRKPLVEKENFSPVKRQEQRPARVRNATSSQSRTHGDYSSQNFSFYGTQV
ncbi:unnamed protein product [Oikopleura dioica]|uniref:FERM domain-containing protein n=2 Tax=Oikopleura dioica TaxID=34765 RepID=E4XJV8_OIKDI|nr:unnamed protein product [Oikopleura dioica]